MFRSLTGRSVLAVSMALALSGGGIAGAQPVTPATGTTNVYNDRDNREQLSNALEHVNKAVRVVRQMEADPGMAALLRKSKGVFIVPDYARAALGVGARGGAGVLLQRRGDSWSQPAFYTMGGLSVGAQAGAEAGAVAFVLNDQRALNSFMQANNFALNAEAGLTLVDWSRKGRGSTGMGNITLWSDTEGLFGAAAVSVTDINFDEDETAAYYKRPVTPREVLASKIKNPHADMLRQAIANAASGQNSAAVGASGTAQTKAGEGK